MTATTFEGVDVVITGGSDGIGFGLARRFLAAGSRVLVTGRDSGKLERAASAAPGLHTLVNDIGVAEERERLAQYLQAQCPGLRVVVNNAGIQRRVSLADDQAPWVERQREIEILFSAVVHLNHLLIPLLLKQGEPCLIANVSSGGALIPQPFAPVYSACKAAIRSYTANLRFALSATPVRVVEIIPPAVRTGLAGTGVAHGADLEVFCDAIFAGLEAGQADELGFGMTDSAELRQRLAVDRALFDGFSGRFPVRTY
ncbi:SDR family NAD(P)-dependent oxidoreductase [Xanthomonas rydalmerensis]|uniref:SDR family NAD(P)-dependent oxidoreductase n=1 Tax=Xanthomonas rydalmerensis TaxID=3046274 RepID=A0ABZ0JJ37_9XANT|nr:SDR family NAD(P)-dependent oxidoreductase [Xanthomonas sp. DM-2023]WOS39769.1 SDR family NAD(P)-dependent oxidoreductase [Xanthomonas sp. DM-2023]WOS43953.1 SDR family NAD(P)-dependent oxidoreductase [Xanthomonas sp. DM-2023]WOS48133.1 SDR family NAD(P)-dependent oxidoreductase [Xanthomonas sp. DM-2023]WOS52312.1 SDR family NAD(P)-dependent oxidoreductase [Xanthomonas sp. DM-2023]WOS56496.1 SDR family NAD(P)-dependent oxidoreductase [Xanthomonas sp. DM-2023]